MRNKRFDENISTVSENFEKNPWTFIQHRSQQLGINRQTLNNILRKHLHLKLYKMQLVQEIKPVDHELRRHFVEWCLQSHVNLFDFVIFIDEAHFELGSLVNKQNCQIKLGEENPREILKTSMHPQKCTLVRWRDRIVFYIF